MMPSLAVLDRPARRNGKRLAGVALAALLVICALMLLAHPARASDEAQQSSLLSALAAENAALSAEIVATSAALERARADLGRLQDSQRDLEQSMQRIERHAQVHALGRVFAQTVIEQLRVLPRAGGFDAERVQRDAQLEATSDANLRAERALDQLADLDAAVTTRLAAAQPPIPEGLWSQVRAAARDRLAEQRSLLSRLDDLQGQLLHVLQESDDADLRLAQRTHAARADLTRLLFWVPARPGIQTIGELAPSWAWMTSAANWRAVGTVLLDQFIWQPLAPALAVLLALSLYFGRRRLQSRLVVLAPAVANYDRYWIGHTAAALVITFVLALPGPLLMWTAAKLLASAAAEQSFPLALSDALAATAKLVVALSALAWLLDERGVAGGHFGWDEAALSFARRALRRFSMVFVPLILIVTLNGMDHAPYGNRESIGRMCFSLAMLVVAFFLARLFRRKSPLMERLWTRAPRSWAVRLHALWFGALIAGPLGIAGLAAAGYFVAAGYFFGRTMVSVFMVLGAVALYGLIALWVQVERWRLSRRQAEEAWRLAQAETDQEEGSEIADPPPPQLDVAAIGEQTRSLLDLFITLLLLSGLWLVWKGSVPALSIISDYALWTYNATVDGKSTTLPLTVGNLFLAVVVGVVTAIAVRNVGALLDIVLLRRFEVQADATYAIKVIARYVLAAAGIVAACSIVGIAWTDVHWLIAAMGVGLGFGLQEIVANFVSGLIVLAERPIRIGDVVTVGEVSGTVSRIRARATSVVDFDNKEVIIPNKEFITGSVVNWTLSNQTTRLLLKVGVAYGSDLALVRRVLLEVVQANDDVLDDPSPSAYFVDFGDSSLDFEIRAFVDSFDKRLRVTHELNLAVEAALRGNNIEIPFPQRDLHIRSAAGLAGIQASAQPQVAGAPESLAAAASAARSTPSSGV